MTLPGVPASVPTARRFVRDALQTWGLTEVLDSAMLIVSELATNAVLHAGGEVTVWVSSPGDGTVRLEVIDDSARVPQLRGYGDEATTGRGLRMVASLATDWGVEPQALGKTVWALLDSAAEAGAA